ncbi:MAG: hypothetical protein Phog2KO_47490 [Phototrophicaceae bacterium]
MIEVKIERQKVKTIRDFCLLACAVYLNCKLIRHHYALQQHKNSQYRINSNLPHGQMRELSAKFAKPPVINTFIC